MKTFTKSALFLFWLIPMSFFAQDTVNGTVTSATDGQPIPGVNIVVKGTTNGTATDFDGIYSLNNVNSGDIIVFSYVGFVTQEIAYSGNKIDVALQEDAAELEQVVVIGYGNVRKKDLTGSVQLITTEDLNQGAITSADQLLNGKSPGLRIVTSGGEPDATSNIRIRGGASLTASNAPLIVIDGVPVSNNNPAGQQNVLALVNPNDIESFSILKDASAAAIYGSRASNGVIIITTKKGTSGAPKFEFNSNIQIGTLPQTLDLFNSSDFVTFINNNFPDQTDLLGLNGTIFDTDWQEAIYRTSFTSDNNLTARANLFGKVPFRASAGYAKIEGILLESQLDRYTSSISAAPKLLNESLTVAINAKYIGTRKDEPNQEAIGSALTFNPTLPIIDPNGNTTFGDFFQPLQSDGSLLGPSNPVAVLRQRDRDENADRFIGNIKFDYALPFLPELKAVLNLGLDYSESVIEETIPENSINAYNVNSGTPKFNPGRSYFEEQLRRDHTLDAYFSYTKDFEGFLNRIDAQAGYAYQNFENSGTIFRTTINDDGDRVDQEPFRYFNPQNLQSFFGRINVNLAEKYLLTASLRADASSFFEEEERWGFFPSTALAWVISEENFLQDSDAITNLKLRVGYGITGQQDISGISFFPYLPLYLTGDPTVSYVFGNELFTTYRADPLNPNLTWEKTTTYNIGLDYGLWDGLFEGSVDYYKRDTEDLLALVPQAPGTNLRNFFTNNIGSTESEGVETAIVFRPINRGDVSLEFNANFAFNETFVTDLKDFTQIPIGDTGIGRGTGINIGQYTVGGRGRNFWLFEQIYDTDGNPIPDAFVDQNGDNQINDEDRVFTPYDPKWTYGFGTSFRYKGLDFTANFRGQLGGKVYNANLMRAGFAEAAIPVTGNGFLNNSLNLLDANGVYQGFVRNPSDNQALSDLYVSDATFLRLDNVTLGYDLKRLFSTSYGFRVYASINNAFVITDYEGLDPENFTGIEQSPYARPRTYTFGVNVNF